MKRKLTGLSIFILTITLLSACAGDGSSAIPYASIPTGKAYADGNEIFFSHTETSDPEVADKLTNMMKSPVLVVPSLADAPDSMLAFVYVFTNGVVGNGPLGFQPDVFNFPPGTEGYSPLRKIIFVTWVETDKVRELRSEGDIMMAEKAGELKLESSKVVVNMPFMTWEGGKR